MHYSIYIIYIYRCVKQESVYIYIIYIYRCVKQECWTGLSVIRMLSASQSVCYLFIIDMCINLCESTIHVNTCIQLNILVYI